MVFMELCRARLGLARVQLPLAGNLALSAKILSPGLTAAAVETTAAAAAAAGPPPARRCATRRRSRSCAAALGAGCSTSAWLTRNSKSRGECAITLQAGKKAGGCLG